MYADIPWDELVARFSLGSLRTAPERATTGWGGHNVLWKVQTSDGDFAVKQVGRSLPEESDGPFAVELAAHAGGVPSPRPVPSVEGRCYEVFCGAAFRCHEWIEGRSKFNEDVSSDEATEMGALVARLHGCAIATNPLQPRPLFKVSEWRHIAAQGEAVNAPWASILREHAARLVEIQQQARMHAGDGLVVGSHRDLNAHNVLFTNTGLVLIDWDAAGPAVPQTERAVVSMLWSQRHDGRYDADRTRAFLSGYREGGGVIHRSDADRLTEWLDGLVWWMHENLEMALTMKSLDQHRAAEQLLLDTLKGPETVAERQAFLTTVITDLDRGASKDLP